ncbi:MAG: MarR family transcriptional regulator [Eubacteriales bacterium]|nr:MarR family transcriptional regulator [Eubacteriales bacterium]
MNTYATLNDVLVNLFRDIMMLEEHALITDEYQDITNNDMHVIEAIGIGEPKNMSTIAKLLSVTVGTLTIAMNSLVKKGYVTRQRSSEDRRVVYISLSEKGRKAYRHHEQFHREMIDAILEDLTQEETESLVSALAKLEKWFRRAEDNQKEAQ